MRPEAPAAASDTDDSQGVGLTEQQRERQEAITAAGVGIFDRYDRTEDQLDAQIEMLKKHLEQALEDALEPEPEGAGMLDLEGGDRADASAGVGAGAFASAEADPEIHVQPEIRERLASALAKLEKQRETLTVQQRMSGRPSSEMVGESRWLVASTWRFEGGLRHSSASAAAAAAQSWWIIGPSTCSSGTLEEEEAQEEHGYEAEWEVTQVSTCRNPHDSLVSLGRF